MEIQLNTEKHKDLGEYLEDSDLNESEKKKLQEDYGSSCEEIHDETQVLCDDLQEEVQIFQDLKKLSPKNIIILQKLSGALIDGKNGPNTFSFFLQFRKNFSIISDMSISEILGFYETIGAQFNSFSKEKREEIQTSAGAYPDSIFGTNTFKKIIGNYDESQKYFTNIEKKPQPQEIVPPQEKVVSQEKVISKQDTIHKKTEDRVQVEAPLVMNTPTKRPVSPAERKLSLIDEAGHFGWPLIKQLQKELGDIGVDGTFGEISATEVLKKHPEAKNLQELFDFYKIDTSIDKILTGPNSSIEEAREIFNEKYGELINVLGDNLGLPVGFIESIVMTETTYGKDLENISGSKGLMQLTGAPFEDMGLDKHRHKKYAPLFQRLDMGKIMNLKIDDSLVSSRMPINVVNSFRILANKNTDLKDFQEQILVLEKHLKGDASLYDHEANLIVGAVYLAYLYQHNNGSIHKSSKRYNGEANGGDEIYANNVVNNRRVILDQQK